MGIVRSNHVNITTIRNRWLITKVLIAGSRTITDKEHVFKCIDSTGLEFTEIINGYASGVDRIADDYARIHNIPRKRFYPQWKLHGISAGLKRNVQMVEYCEAAILIWDGKSKGTLFTLEEVVKQNKKLFMFNQSNPFF